MAYEIYASFELIDNENGRKIEEGDMVKIECECGSIIMGILGVVEKDKLTIETDFNYGEVEIDMDVIQSIEEV